MWAALPLLCAGAWLLGPLARGAAGLSVRSPERFRFKSWMVQHQKTYSANEYQHRLQTFANNRRKINAHNSRNHTFTSTWGTPLLQGTGGGSFLCWEEINQ